MDRAPRRRRARPLNGARVNGSKKTLDQAQVDLSVAMGNLMKTLMEFVTVVDDIELASKQGQQHHYALYRQMEAQSKLIQLNGGATKRVLELTGVGIPWQVALHIRTLAHEVRARNEAVLELAGEKDPDPDRGLDELG